MAIYHFSVKNISRSDGRSAVACSAYRSGEKLIDERQGKEQDYTKKTGVEYKVLWCPKGTAENLITREKLWNTVEATEKRKNSQLAREFEIAFPHELNKEQRQEMLNELCKDIVRRHNVVVDAVIHAPHTKSGSDERNYHAHIMFTTRSINEHGELGKKTREFNDQGKQQVEFWRKKFAEITNASLAKAGYSHEVDHRSYAEQGNGLQATIHEGSKVTQLRRQGIDTEISLKNDLIKQQNAEKQRIPEFLDNLTLEIRLAEYKISKYQEEIRLETPKQPLRATETPNEVGRYQKTQEQPLERKIEPSSSKLRQLTDDLNRIQTEISQFKRDISTALQTHDELVKTKPNQTVMGFIPNPKYSTWREKYLENKNNHDRKRDALERAETLLKSCYSDIRKEKSFLANPPQFPTKEKQPEQNFEHVYQKFSREQKQAYHLMEAYLSKKFNGSELDKKLNYAQEKFIEKFKENPNFEVPKIEFQKQPEQTQGVSKSKGMER